MRGSEAKLFFAAERGESRRSLDELEPSFRQRVLALDEPVARDDWQEVIRRSRVLRLPIRRSGPVLAIAASVVVAVVAGSVYGLRLSSSSDRREAGGRSSQVGLAFASFELGGPPRLSPASLISQTRVITSLNLNDGSHTLYVSPSRDGGFCYEWTGGEGGCESKPAPFGVTWVGARVAGVLSSAAVSSVSIRFTDGTTAKPDVSWISGPINAGFFLYDIPAGKTVAEINGLDAGHTRGQVTWYSV